MLTTLIAPTAGTAAVNGYDVVRDQREVRRSIGYVGQGNGAGHQQRGRDELVSQGRAYGLSKADAVERADLLVRELDLTEVADRVVSTLSGGQRRRLDIALGMVHAPGRALPRRALDRARPPEPRQPPGADPHPARGARHHDRADHPLPGGGRRPRPAGDRHRPRARHRRRHRRPPQVVARRPGHPRLRPARARGRGRRARPASYAGRGRLPRGRRGAGPGGARFRARPRPGPGPRRDRHTRHPDGGRRADPRRRLPAPDRPQPPRGRRRRRHDATTTDTHTLEGAAA